LDITPRGSIAIEDFLGKTLAIYRIEEKRIFPFAIRSFSNTLDKKWLFGRYRAILNGTYGTTGQALTAYLTFWVLPWKIITAVILGLIILVLLGYWLGKRKTKKEEEVETT